MKAYMLLSHTVLGSQDTAAIKIEKTPCPLEKGRERGENMHPVWRAVRIGEGASHILEPDVGCETREGGHEKNQSIREANALGRKNRLLGLSGKVVKSFEMQNIITIIK